MDFPAIFGPPPPSAVPIDWAAAEEWLGLTLPADYKAIAIGTPFLEAVTPWQPPPAVMITPERRAAVTEGSGLAALTALVPPPETPYPGEDRDWDSLFAALGTRLPAEYVTLMNRYGGGCWRDWFRFLTPLRATFTERVGETLEAYRQVRADWPEDLPLAAWPEPGGFLPFANSVDGDEVGWLTDGDPDSWPLIVWPRHADQGAPLPDGLIDTLLAWMRGRYETAGLPPLDADDDPAEFATFESWDDDAYW